MSKIKPLKGFNKLSLQIILFGIGLILISYFTDTQVWLDQFNFKVDGSKIPENYLHLKGCTYNECNGNTSIHYHWNYRGYIYFLTGLTLAVISLIRIGNSHKEDDFK